MAIFALTIERGGNFESAEAADGAFLCLLDSLAGNFPLRFSPPLGFLNFAFGPDPGGFTLALAFLGHLRRSLSFALLVVESPMLPFDLPKLQPGAFGLSLIVEKKGGRKIRIFPILCLRLP